MQSGTLTVTGENSTLIALSGKPREVEVHFKDSDDRHVPCNPHHHDHLHWRIVSEDEDRHVHMKINHHHHDRLFFLSIEWRVDGVREIDWFVIY